MAQQAKQSYDDEHQAFEDYRSGDLYAAMEDLVHGVPILGPGLIAAAEEAPVSTGSYRQDIQNVIASGPTMGTLLGTSIRAASALDMLRLGAAVVDGAAGGGPPAGGSEVGGTSPGTTETAGAGIATEAAGADAATPPADASPATEGATPATPPADAEPATESTEPPSEGSDDDDDRGGDGTSPAPTPVDAAPIAADVSTFSSSFSQIMQSIKESELGRRAPDVLRDGLQTIFQDHPNLRLQTPNRIVEVPPSKFFTLPSEVWDVLKDMVIDPLTEKTLGQEQGLEVSQQGTDGGGLAKPPDAPVEVVPETVATPEGQTATEDSPQPDVGTGAAVANTPATNTSAANTPATNPPATTTPATNTPATNAPATNTPASPNAQAPSTEPSSTQPTGNANASSSPPSTAGTAVTSPSGAPTLNIGKQAKHSANLIQGRRPEPDRSLLTADPYEMLQYAGKGQQVSREPRGVPGFKERVDVGKVIGNHYDKDAKQWTPSTKIIIVYDGKNTVHIYPGQP